MKVLVAGAGGYIGARAVAAFRAIPGAEVVGVCRQGGDASLDLATDRDALRAVFARLHPDVVINAAGTISPDMHRCLSAHVDVTANLLSLAAELAPGARFVQLGSAAEYGDAVHEPDAMREDTLPVPQGAYGVSKLAATLLAVREGTARGLHPVSLRVFNLIGRDMTPGTIIPNVVRFLRLPGRRRDDPFVAGALDIHRDFVHIDDVIAAVILAATVPASRMPAGSIVNVSSGRTVVVRDAVRELLDAAGHAGPIEERAAGSGRSGGVRWALGDNRRAREWLGWQPRHTLSSALRELVQ